MSLEREEVVPDVRGVQCEVDLLEAQNDYCLCLSVL